MLPRREIVQRTLPITTAEPVVRTGRFATNQRGFGEAGNVRKVWRAIDTQRIARNNNLQPINGDLGNRETRRHTGEVESANRKGIVLAILMHSVVIAGEWHDCNWWRQHCNTIVFVGGGYYYLDARLLVSGLAG